MALIHVRYYRLWGLANIVRHVLLVTVSTSSS
jgi:hypothetical protein